MNYVCNQNTMEERKKKKHDKKYKQSMGSGNTDKPEQSSRNVKAKSLWKVS